jgi:hypothetical protein
MGETIKIVTETLPDISDIADRTKWTDAKLGGLAVRMNTFMKDESVPEEYKLDTDIALGKIVFEIYSRKKEGYHG